MKKINYPLIFGIIIVLFLTIITFNPALFTSKDPLFEETPKYIQYKEKGEWVEKFGHNPMPPNKDNVLGTDDAGRDIYSRLIYGTRNTLKLALLVAVFRIILALPLGLAAGMGLKLISGIIKIFNTFFTAIPMLIFSFIVLNIGYFKMLQMDKAIYAFAIVLAIVGWAKLAGMIEDSTRIIMEEDFIEGEVAIGKTKLQIAYQNVLPHIIPTGVSLFFKEMGMALFLVAQLAVLYVFVGVTRLIKELAFKANYDMILEPEWGGMLSRIAVDVKRYSNVYWMTLYPVLVFSIAITGINLTGEGLRLEFQKRNSRVISYIRKTYYQLSPRLFISQIIDFKRYYKPVIIKSLIIIIIIAYFIIPWHPSIYKFDIDQANIFLKELTNNKYQGRAPGSEGGYLAGEYIIDTLRSYGYIVETMEIPLTETLSNIETSEEFIIPKPMAPIEIESGWIKLKDKEGTDKTYYLYEDFIVPTVNMNIFMDMAGDKISYKGIAASAHKASNIPEGIEFFPINNMFPFLHEFDLTTPNIVEIDKDKKLKYDIEFVVFEGEEDYFSTNTYSYRSTAIFPFGDLREELESGYKEVEINFDYPTAAKYPARNIIGFLPGKDKTRDDPGEVIIIGSCYDGSYNRDSEAPHAISATTAAVALELARQISLIDKPLEKSIEFIFWDNESEFFVRSPLDGSDYYHLTAQRDLDMALTHGYYYIDIGYPGFSSGNEKYLDLITTSTQRADGKSYLIGLGIEKRLKEMNIKYRRFHYDYELSNPMYNLRLNAFTSIGLGNSYMGGANYTWDTLDNIDYEKMEDIGQIILDTITMNPHLMDNKALGKENGHD